MHRNHFLLTPPAATAKVLRIMRVTACAERGFLDLPVWYFPITGLAPGEAGPARTSD